MARATRTPQVVAGRAPCPGLIETATQMPTHHGEAGDAEDDHQHDTDHQVHQVRHSQAGPARRLAKDSVHMRACALYGGQLFMLKAFSTRLDGVIVVCSIQAVSHAYTAKCQPQVEAPTSFRTTVAFGFQGGIFYNPTLSTHVFAKNRCGALFAKLVHSQVNLG